MLVGRSVVRRFSPKGASPSNARPHPQVCKAYCHAIDESKSLQYFLRLSMCGYLDSPTPSNLSPAHRIHVLQTHIDRWHTLDWTESRIRIPHGFLYEFMTGVYCTATTESLTVVRLPSRDRGFHAKLWTHHDFDFHIVDFTFDPSQDLLVLAEKFVSMHPFQGGWLY